MKAFKSLKAAKFILFVIWGILIFIFKDKIAEHSEEHFYLAALVASLMFAYSIFDFIDMLEKKKTLAAHTKLFDCIIQVVFGIIILADSAIRENYATICIIWAVWSICREGEELAEDLERFKEHIPAYLNVIESIIVLVLSFMLIANPHPEHAKLHLILLGFELILGVVFPHVDYLFIKRHARKELAEKQKEEVVIADEQ
ncbi:MAG: hypothetical protein K6E87_03270 [bacterium]|nr:hypothetical protein [bacterium]